MTLIDTAPPKTEDRTGGGWALSSRFMLRVAGLPIQSVQSLRCPDARRRAEELLAEEDRLHAQGAGLSDRIAGLLTTVEDGRSRRRVLDLRRTVFNNRLPGDVPAALELAGSLGGPTGDALAAWLTDRLRLEDSRRAAEAAFGRDLAASRAALRRLAEEERIRLGLLLASPTLEGQVDAFVRAAADAPDKRGRKLERSLLSYLYRTACKTSPFSTFTSLSTGRFDPSATGGASEVAVSREWSGHPRLNVLVLARLAQVIADDPGRRGDLPVAPASGLVLGEGRIRYVRRSTSAGDDSRSVTFDTARDQVFFLRSSGLLERLLELFGDGRELRCAEVLAWLGAHADAEPEKAGHYLDALLDLGLLQLAALATDVHDHDPLRAFQASLRSLRRPWADAVADRLEGPADWIAGYARCGVAERRAVLSRLRSELLDIQRELGAQTPSLPQILLYEDVTTAPTAADPGLWERLAAEPLRDLSPLFPAYDAMLANRLTLKGFFFARYGRGGRSEDLLTLVHDFHEDIFDRYLDHTARRSPSLPDGSPQPEPNWLRMPEVTALDLAREEFVARMRRSWDELPADADELLLDPEAVRSAAAHLAPISPGGFGTQTYFLQLADRGQDPLAVLNNSYGSVGFPFTRFTHCFESGQSGPGSASLAAELRETLRSWQPEGAVFAEITAGSATTNLNLHGRLTEYQIVCPGELSSAAPDHRLPLDDLLVEHDEATDRLVLRSRRLGREVVPLYFGYLVPEALPEIPRTLLLLAPSFQVQLDVWRGVPQRPAVDGVTGRPRVRYRGLVLHRRSWTADSGVLPAREPGGSEADWYLRWQRWRARHGLPDQVFARVHEQQRGGKPQYVDFASPLSLLALEGEIGGKQARVVFEEMLPAEDSLHVRSERGDHMAELAVELIPADGPAPATDPNPQEGPR
jgi:hypothetical protein